MSDPWWKGNEWCTDSDCKYVKCIHHIARFPKELEGDTEHIAEPMRLTDKCIYRFEIKSEESRKKHEQQLKQQYEAENHQAQ